MLFVFYPFVSFLHGFCLFFLILFCPPYHLGFPPDLLRPGSPDQQARPRQEAKGREVRRRRIKLKQAVEEMQDTMSISQTQKTQKNQNILYRASQTAIWESGYGKGKTFFSRKG